MKGRQGNAVDVIPSRLSKDPKLGYTRADFHEEKNMTVNVE
jgi:hypothetical protein